MSQDRENASSEDIMVPEISSSTPDISETRAHHSSDDVMVATVDSSVASPMSQEVDDDNSDDLIAGTGDSNDASPSTSQDVADECSNASDLIVGTSGNNEASSSMSQEVDDESSNTGEFMIETTDSDDTSSMSQEFVDEYPNGGDTGVETKGSNDASPILQEVAECSNTQNIGTVEDHSIAGEISELVLSVSIANPEDLPCSEDCNISPPVTPPTQMDTSSLSVDQTKQADDNKNKISLSPSKRRHLSSKQEPESKKPNTSKESDEELLVCNYDVKLEETLALQSPVDLPECVAEVVPQSMKDPVIGDLESKTDTHEGSTVSNVSNKTPICEAPPVSGQTNPTKEIRKEKPECVAEARPQSVKDSVLCDLDPKTDTHEDSTESNDSNKTPICEVPPISTDQKNPTKEIPKEKPECVAEAGSQSVKDSVLCDLDPKTDILEGFTVSNDSNKTPIYEVPPISGQENPTKEIRKEKPKFSTFFNNIRLTWETFMEESSDQAINLSSRDIPSESKDTSQTPVQYKEDVGGKSQFEIVSAGHQPPQESTSSEVSEQTKPSDLIKDTAQNSFPILLPVEIQPLTQDNFIPELESLVAEYEKEMQTETLGEPIIEEQLRTFQIQYIEAVNGFQGALEQTLSRIQNLELSPDINVSSLVTISSDLLIAAVRVEKVWREFKVLLAENSDSINVINMIQNRTRCLQYFEKFILAILRYIYNLPVDYPRESES